MAYVYLLKNHTTGTYYYGSKYSAYGCDPEKFWVDYHTSSNVVFKLRQMYGDEDFSFEILEISEDVAHIIELEKSLIKEHIHDELCLNGHYGGSTDGDPNKGRKLRIHDGLSNYEIVNRRVAKERGSESYTKALLKAVKKDPTLPKRRSAAAHATLSQIGEDGLTGHQRQGLKVRGDKNSSKWSGDKISVGRKRYIRENQATFLEHNAAINRKLSTERDEFGKTARDRHSEWMLENNPTKDTIWITNEAGCLRWPIDKPIPKGYSKGRKVKAQEVIRCPHCGQEGGKGAMKRYHFERCKAR